jgi:hypothetical protein
LRGSGRAPGSKEFFKVTTNTQYPETKQLNCRSSKNDPAGGSINSEDSESLRMLQARRLTRCSAISLDMATIIAPLMYGETVQ